jgi:hypothetical protein
VGKLQRESTEQTDNAEKIRATGGGHRGCV